MGSACREGMGAWGDVPVVRQPDGATGDGSGPDPRAFLQRRRNSSLEGRVADQVSIPAGMSLDEYDFELPESQIAAWPASERGRDRLLVMNRTNGTLQHLEFACIESLLREGDVLVMNDVRVRKARLAATKDPGGGKVEILLLGEREDSGRVWECLLHSARAMRVGQVLQVQGGPQAVGPPVKKSGRYRVCDSAEQCCPGRDWRHPAPTVHHAPASKYGSTGQRTLPNGLRDRALAVAAPTAGLHFTDEILQAVRARGVITEFITLEVGWGTFAPVRVDDIRQHKMHSERFEIREEVAQRLMQAKAEGRRIIAVGTTVVRALESAARLEGGSPVIEAGIRSTDIFITPGYAFKAVDGMITNFHTPKSTLLVLVSAFAGREAIRSAYQTAVREGYRFFSYGDAMLIL